MEDLDFLVDVSKIDISFDDNKLVINNNKEEPNYYLTYRLSNFYDDKEFIRFIKNTERLIRNSIEYKNWVLYLRESCGCDKCFITDESSEIVNVEIHHHPVTLYNICNAIINKKIKETVKFSTFDICNETLELHYSMKVGVVPLITSLHEKYHSGTLLLPMESVIGDYKYFIDNYIEYLTIEEQQQIYKKLIVNKDNCGWKVKWVVF